MWIREADSHSVAGMADGIERKKHGRNLRHRKRQDTCFLAPCDDSYQRTGKLGVAVDKGANLHSLVVKTVVPENLASAPNGAAVFLLSDSFFESSAMCSSATCDRLVNRGAR